MKNEIKFWGGEELPLELHKVRVVQKLHLVPVERRLEAIAAGGFNTFKLSTPDVFLDMLTDSGTNAMSDDQLSAMFRADDAYAGSQSFERLHGAVREVLGKELLLPVHQGRAAEHIICRTFVRPGDVVPMNYHFTTFYAHAVEQGGGIEELLCDGALDIHSENPFKGNMDIAKLEECIARNGAGKIAFVRMEASTNLIGGQPFSMANLREVRRVADRHGLMLVLDASLIGENAYLIKKREPEWHDAQIRAILHEMTSMADIVYFSARKLSSSRGGGICTDNKDLYLKMEVLVPLFEGFLTYGGISTREMEAMAVGLFETLDETAISQSPQFIGYMVGELMQRGIPCVTPAGVLGCHVDAREFCSHIAPEQYPAGALAAAFYIASGVRGMERGTLSNARDTEGREVPADVELLRLAIPRRVLTLSQIRYAIDRLAWLWENRSLIGGLRFTYEPAVLRFFMGSLEPVGDWPHRLARRFREDFGESL
ncbi:MAG: tryptophanase [Rikenellaceae bacterium]|nr:tryptophanase [Rikenellaceae bacterium]MCL2692487.1 tryptophanase [Rikenellaceae bacterium]